MLYNGDTNKGTIVSFMSRVKVHGTKWEYFYGEGDT